MTDRGSQTRIRAFLALPLAEVFGHEIAAYLNQIRRGIQGIKWVLPEQVHVTFHFFGSVSPEDAQKAASIIRPLVSEFPPLEVSLTEVGAFPNLRRPRVVWIGVHEGSRNLLRLQGRLEKHLSHAGFSVEERTFKAHATLGRVRKESMPPPSFQALPAFPATDIRKLGQLVLYQSHLGPEGPRYEILETFPFSEKPAA